MIDATKTVNKIDYERDISLKYLEAKWHGVIMGGLCTDTIFVIIPISKK